MRYEQEMNLVEVFLINAKMSNISYAELHNVLTAWSRIKNSFKDGVDQSAVEGLPKSGEPVTLDKAKKIMEESKKPEG